MLPLYTREEMRRVDRDAVARWNVPSIVLMENAGRGAADALCARFPDALERVVLVGGPGQNGGDAWVIARRLTLSGLAPVAVLVGAASKLAGDAAANWGWLRHLGVETHEVAPADASAMLAGLLEGASLVVDGLFGTGLVRPIDGGYADAVRAINATHAPVLSLDLPSGIDADTGAVLGEAVDAALTVTFAGMKRGLQQYPGVAHARDVFVVDIGVDTEAIARDAGCVVAASLWDRDDLAGLLPPRAGDAHKGTNGHVLVVGGAPGTTGAAVLAGRSALRGGAGLVTIGAREDAREALEQKVVNLMTTPLGADATPEAVRALCEGKVSAVVGPGLGLDETGQAWTRGFAEHAPVPVVLDADALTVLAHGGVDLRAAAGPRVLTPHPGEAGRLLAGASSAVQADRYAAAAHLQQATGQTVILKGARTIVASAGALRVCAEGTAALGVAGTGDVLAGLTGAMLASLEPANAAIAAALLHAVAAEHAAPGDRGLIAAELADAVPHVVAAL